MNKLGLQEAGNKVEGLIIEQTFGNRKQKDLLYLTKLNRNIKMNGPPKSSFEHFFLEFSSMDIEKRTLRGI